MNPLAELSTVPHGDVRQRQLECVLQILNGAWSESLSHGWPLVLGIIGAVNDRHGEALIRIAFQCLQLVVTDFLPVMPWLCLPGCVNTAAKFGSQTVELNISLTAVGLMVSYMNSLIQIRFQKKFLHLLLLLFSVEYFGLFQSKSRQTFGNRSRRSNSFTRFSWNTFLEYS